MTTIKVDTPEQALAELRSADSGFECPQGDIGIESGH
jgi:hypothetical protein